MTALILATLLVPDATPKATVQSFVDALHAHDAAAAARLVVGGRPVSTRLTADDPGLRAVLGAERIDGEDATVEVDEGFTFRGSSSARLEHETVRLRRVEGDWRIVPALVPAEGVRRFGGLNRPGLVADWATTVTNDALLAEVHRAGLRSKSLSNAKAIAVATFEYAAHHNERLPDAARFRSAIGPYLKGASDVFVAPDAPAGTTYFFDPRLSGRSLTAIGPIAEVAMIVMGRGRRAAFAYDGKTIIAYTDGHVNRADPAKAVRARAIPLG